VQGSTIKFINADFMLKRLLDVNTFENFKKQENYFGYHHTKNKDCLYYRTGQ